ncbi:hypothetical protein PoB_004093700 [Plakobranchus ocellatus]|uniref:Uncharacterized protein n=1 Tax=Plakobranchus ocellatus TaxID=259542 RepID=A0AAV4B5R6_9GAST|nr:hypothetical protein PoB_004093700 [Plakobranchus ocellatus]
MRGDVRCREMGSRGEAERRESEGRCEMPGDGEMGRNRKEGSPEKHIKKISLDVAHASNVGHSRAATVDAICCRPKTFLAREPG